MKDVKARICQTFRLEPIVTIYIATCLIEFALAVIMLTMAIFTITANTSSRVIAKWEWLWISGQMVFGFVGFVLFCLSVYVFPYCLARALRLFRQRDRCGRRYLGLSVLAAIITCIGVLIIAIVIAEAREGK